MFPHHFTAVDSDSTVASIDNIDIMLNCDICFSATIDFSRNNHIGGNPSHLQTTPEYLFQFIFEIEPPHLSGVATLDVNLVHDIHNLSLPLRLHEGNTSDVHFLWRHFITTCLRKHPSHISSSGYLATTGRTERYEVGSALAEEKQAFHIVQSDVDQRPGADEVILAEAGKDTTDVFDDVDHSEVLKALLEDYSAILDR
ncbi:hypothetical protein GG344DRAFT_77142 [Lentinula edodes]|nr:hypothetical protein GG344DRAFT_77142 [Lentinula edodes]